jgi:hypothetical protein
VQGTFRILRTLFFLSWFGSTNQEVKNLTSNCYCLNKTCDLVQHHYTKCTRDVHKFLLSAPGVRPSTFFSHTLLVPVNFVIHHVHFSHQNVDRIFWRVTSVLNDVWSVNCNHHQSSLNKVIWWVRKSVMHVTSYTLWIMHLNKLEKNFCVMTWPTVVSTTLLFEMLQRPLHLLVPDRHRPPAAQARRTQRPADHRSPPSLSWPPWLLSYFYLWSFVEWSRSWLIVNLSMICNARCAAIQWLALGERFAATVRFHSHLKFFLFGISYCTIAV